MTALTPKRVKAGLHQPVPVEDAPKFPFHDPKLAVKPEVRFISGGDEEADSALAVAIEAATPRLTVRVCAPFRVSHGGRHYKGGDIVEVPADQEHRWWLAAGWVQLAQGENPK
ncbi:hypothetical protein [Candidatus Mycobacterium methanotrophicum]|uniref:Uncharacterized protein n=1 Tax=Candidatus Mycobacterium methanotrophicum TaxID=2943498 RepID=A0ABY4QKF0_9MYCO|nr:hypothetical protein [Candidatus Mycobacterium methanotrophicum]UQX11324.1 hypothetical protein M5I08_01935 [Candidatus Mycobacterium methanotrophicum]